MSPVWTSGLPGRLAAVASSSPAEPGAPAGPIIALLALMLAAALVGASVGERLRLPRIVGWLGAGLGLRWILAGLDRAGLTAAAQLGQVTADGPALRFVTQLALVGVMLSIGMAFELHHVRRLGKPLLWVVLAQAGASLGATFAACGAVGGLAGADQPLVIGLLLGATAVSVSPAAVLLTIRQYEAKGHATDDILSVTGLSTVIAVFLFDLSLLVLVEVGQVAVPGGAAGVHLAVLRLMSATLGSVLAGIAAGLVLSLLHARLGAGQAGVSVLAVMLGVLALSGPLSLNYLVVGLLAGVTFVNLGPDPDSLQQRLGAMGAPLFALLFVSAGYSLHLEVFAHPATAALVGAYVLARAGGKLLAPYLVARRLGAGEVFPRLGLGLLAQNGVTYGLAASLAGFWPAGAPAWVVHLRSVALGAIVLSELIGPILLKYTLVSAGEVKAIRLFHFPAGRRDAFSRLAEGIMSLLRRLGVLSLPRTADGTLRARHVMRTAVRLLPSGAALHEVLRFIERSRLDHFPVADGENRFVGTISLADVRDIIYEPEVHDLVTAQDLLEDEQVTARPDDTLEALFDNFRAHKARDLIVLDERTGQVVGIVEQRDVLRAMHVQQTRRQVPAEH